MLLLLLLSPKLRTLELTPMLRLGENAEAGVAVASSKMAVFIMVSVDVVILLQVVGCCNAKKIFEILNE